MTSATFKLHFTPGNFVLNKFWNMSGNEITGDSPNASYKNAYVALYKITKKDGKWVKNKIYDEIEKQKTASNKIKKFNELVFSIGDQPNQSFSGFNTYIVLTPIASIEKLLKYGHEQLKDSDKNQIEIT